jgi:hypothetical protein
MKVRLLRCLVLIWILVQAGAPAWAGTLKADEQVLIFTTAGSYDRQAGGWRVPVHVWVFEPEADSLWRGAVVAGLQQALGLSTCSEENLIFRARAAWFLADSESGKRLGVRGGTGAVDLGPTGGNGHARQEMFLPAPLPSGEAPQGLELTVAGPGGRLFRGQALLVPPHGVSVVSDIDDTIKVSQVKDKEALLANTFLRPFRAVPGMAEAYRRWAEKGAAFHYLSASPWQLYPPIEEFLIAGNFPPGSLQLRDFRLKDRSFFNRPLSRTPVHIGGRCFRGRSGDLRGDCRELSEAGVRNLYTGYWRDAGNPCPMRAVVPATAGVVAGFPGWGTVAGSAEVPRASVKRQKNKIMAMYTRLQRHLKKQSY